MPFPTSSNDLPANHADGQTITSTGANAVEVDVNALTVKLGTGSSTPATGLVLTGTGSGTSAWQSPSGGSGSVTVQDPTGSAVTARGTIEFTGDQVRSVVDDGSNSKTVITLGNPVSSTPFSVGPFPQDDSGWAREVLGGLMGSRGISRAPLLTTLAQANKLHLPASIASLRENPPSTLQAQINATSAGGVCYITPGYIYREAVTINKAITLIGRGLISLRGTNDWSTSGGAGNSWSGSTTFTSSLTIPTMSEDPDLTSSGYHPTDVYSSTHMESVFVDGVAIQLVNVTPAGQQWAIDGSRHVVLGFNPSGHKIEVTTRQTVITLQGNNDFIMDGVDIRQVATAATLGGVQAINSSNVTTAKFWILNCMIGWCHGTAINPGGMTNSNILIENNLFHSNGCAGVGGSTNTNMVARRNIFFNNGLSLWGYDPTFGSGGIKVTSSNGVDYDSNIAFNNHGCGLWVDIYCMRFAMRSNIIWDNYGGGSNGIRVEICEMGVVRDNVLFRTPNMTGGLANADIGLDIENSRYVDAYNNTVMHYPYNIRNAWYPGRGDPAPWDAGHTGGNTMHGNRVIGRYQAADQSGQSDVAIHWADDGSGTYATGVTTNTGGVIAGTSLPDGDLFGYPALINSGTSYLESQQEPDNRWLLDGTGWVWDIATFQSSYSGRLGQNARYMSEAERIGELVKWGLLP